MSPPDTSTPEVPTHAVASNFKLPTFSAIDAATWFRRTEVQFRIKHIKNTTLQADHVLAALPDALFPQMSEWLDTKGDDPIEYDDLKKFLLKKFSPTPEQRVKTIFDLSRQALGDQRPSDALIEMRALTRLNPNSNGTSCSLDLLRALWLQRLPDSIRSSITNFNDTTDDHIANLADQLLDAHQAASRTSLTATVDVPSEDEADDAIALASYTRQRQPHYQQPPFPTKNSSRNSSQKRPPPFKKNEFSAKLCFYHARFGPKAKKCEPPCAWPKNAQ